MLVVGIRIVKENIRLCLKSDFAPVKVIFVEKLLLSSKQ